MINADQLEVSPDGTTFYFQACTGPLYRIATRWLDDPGISDQDRVQHVALFADTPSTGGTAIDAAGNIYSSDTDHSRILKIAPDGTTTTLWRTRDSLGSTPCGSTTQASCTCRPRS